LKGTVEVGFGVALRQSYRRLAKRAAMMAGRYAHAKQFKRMNRQIKFLRTRLGRLIRDIRRKIEGDEALQETFAVPLGRAGSSAQGKNAAFMGRSKRNSDGDRPSKPSSVIAKPTATWAETSSKAASATTSTPS